MQPWAERRAASLLRHRRDDMRPAARAAEGQTPMLCHHRCDLRQLDPLGRADDLGRKVTGERAAAAGAAVGTMLDDLIGIIADHPAVAFVARFCTAGLGLIPLLLPIRRGRLGGGARGLLRPLQPQHQLNQLFLAQALKIAAAHPARESAKPVPHKGRGHARSHRPRAPLKATTRTTWVIATPPR
jgi:hypothetical protein